MVVGVFVGQNLITFPSFRESLPRILFQAPLLTPLYDTPRKGLETWLVGGFNPSEKY